jgi:Rad3-related DNA helicase
MKTLDQKIYKTVENILYLSDMRNSVNQAIGRLARTSMSVGMVLINDCGYVSDIFPNWANANEKNLESEGSSESTVKRRIDVIVRRGEYQGLIKNFTMIQNQRHV